MRLLFTALATLAFPLLSHAAIAGDWAGVLTLPQSTLRFVIHVSGPDNALKATADSPDQGMTGASVDSIALSGSTLSFAIPYLDVKFSGDVNSSGRIIGTFVQRGTGVPLALARTTAASDPPQLLVRPALPVKEVSSTTTGRASTSPYPPDGRCAKWKPPATTWGNGRSGRSGSKAIFASVWMRRTETHPADIPKLLDAALTRKLASRAGRTGAIDEQVVEDFKIRSGSVEHTVINGQQALRAIGEYQQSGRPITELLVWVYTEHARTYFFLRAQPSQIETLQPAFEQLIQSARIPCRGPFVSSRTASLRDQ